MRLHASLSLAVCALAVACSKDQPELEPVHKSASAPTAAATATAATADPMHGSFTLAQATEGIEGKGPLVATIATSKGTLECKLFDDRAPVTVANFIGLATGKRTWKEPGSGKWVNRPAYDGTTFHRVIKGFMIQGGDPAGDGSGEPGYVIKDELWDGAKHDKAGQLCMANRGPDTNGAQFFITDAPAPHLDKPNPRTGKRTAYTIFGQCAPLDVVHDIAAVKTVPPNRPESAVTIEKVTISRGK